MKEIITGAAAALISAVLFARFKDITESEKKRKDKGMWFVISFLVYAVTDIVSAFTASAAGAGILGTVSLVSAANFIFLLGFIDIKHRRIPNMYVAAALIFRTVMISAEGLAENDLLLLFVRSLAGLAAGGLVTGIAYAVSRKGIGAGDVKMFAAIGYFTGGFAVIDILVYSTLFCCICGIVLIVFRKCKARDCLPMAPFAYAGTMLYLIAGM